jgi:hypothetical protein
VPKLPYKSREPRPHWDEAWLRKKYLQERLTLKEIADLSGVTRRAVLNWMVRFGIPRRTTAETLTGKYVGEKAFFWGRKHSLATRARISSGHADVRGANNPMFGRSGPSSPRFQRGASMETRAKLSKAIRGKRRPDMLGEGNPVWKGGRTSLAAKIRTSVMGVEWRDAVFNRDRYTCQDCGDRKGGNLNAHHLKELSLLLDLYKVTTLHEAFACPAIWDVQNGVTLCEDCHTKKHLRRVYVRLVPIHRKPQVAS